MYFYFANYRFAGAINLKNRLLFVQIIDTTGILNIGTLLALINFNGYLIINDLFN